MIDKETILSATDRGLAVFTHYITTPFRIGRNFLNPLYEDSKASCNVYFDRKSGIYRMKDFGNDDYSGDCFAFVGKIINKDCKNPKEFIDILETISQELHLGMTENNFAPLQKLVPKALPQPAPKKSRPYTVAQKSFSNAELSYWQKYGITQEVLKNYKVVSLSDFKSVNSDGQPYGFNSSDKEPLYGYTNKHYVKIYRPFSDIRFLYGGSLGDNYCFGLEQLPSKGDTLFITGGEKDVMSLSARGFNAICFNSETVNVPQNIIKKLSYMFKHIVLLYDMDKTGQESSLKHQEQLNVKRLLLPLPGTKESKDISDYFRLGNSAADFNKLFLELLETIYSDTMSILKSCEVDFRNPPPQAKMIISVNDVPLGTQGNLLCVTGGEGTGKSNYVGSLVAGAICKESVEIDTLGITVTPNTKGKAVLLYDTEQSEVQLYKNSTNIVRRAKLTDMPHYLKAYCLTGMSRKQRMQSIVESMDKFYYEFGGIQMVVIDGIADLIKGANDEQESIAVVEELYRLAGIYNTCIVCVLHFIPNGMKLRGHLGSELQRKAAAILSIEKDDDPAVSVVKALKVRDGSPLDVPLMQFSWDKKEAMHLYVGEKPKEEKEKRKELELRGVAKDIFSRQQFITYIDLSEQIQAGLDVKDRTAKTYIKFMRDKEIILKDPSNQSYYIIGHL